MKRFQTLMTGLSALALVAAFASPTLAAKTVIEDEELDEVTAAGQPKIAQAETVVGTATAVNFQVNVFAAHIGGQTNLTALTLNNIFGENQIANGVNIQSGSSDNSGIQSNDASQSWGSAKAHDYVNQPGTPGGDVYNICGFGLIVKCHGDAAPGTPGKIALLWEFADEIADSTTVVGNANSANIVVTIVAGTFDEFAQDGLTALTVNNIFGFNQVANGTNISGGAVTGTGVSAGGSVGTTQANTSDQWRGAPKGWTDAGTFF
jgi:hypothetical protein